MKLNEVFLACPLLKKYHHAKEQFRGIFERKSTSGFVEGLNNKIKLLKRIGFGFTNFEHFKLRILQI